MNIQELSQTEKITASYDLRMQKATTRQIHPAGQLMLDVSKDEAKQYILEVDLNDPFFKKVEVKASTNANWDSDGIDSIRIELRYGPPAADGGDWGQRTDLLLTKTSPTASFATFALRDRGNADDAPVVLDYDYRVTVNYRGDVTLGGQAGEVSSVGAPGADADGWFTKSYARNLVIDPRDSSPAHMVKISTGVLRFDLVQEATLDVTALGASQTFRLTSDAHDVALVLRPDGGATPGFHTSGTIFYKDQARVPIADVDWRADERLVVIDEPRDATLRVTLLFVDPSAIYTKATVTMHYEDGDRVVEKDFDFTAHGQTAEFSVRLDHADKKGYTFRTTLIKASGAVETTDFKDSTASRIIVGLQAADVMRVAVVCLEPVPTPKLLAIRVDLDYRDVENDVHWTRSELIRAGFPGSFTWTVPLADPMKRTYTVKLTAFRPTGPQELPLVESDELEYVLPLLGAG
jgi:hypothetical protein